MKSSRAYKIGLNAWLPRGLRPLLFQKTLDRLPGGFLILPRASFKSALQENPEIKDGEERPQKS